MIDLEAIRSLGQSRSTEAAMGWLLGHLSGSPFSAFRYYHYDLPQERLASIDSAGMPAKVASALRSGAVIRFLRSTPLDSHDSFWCLHEKEPIVFVVDEGKARERLCPETAMSDVKVVYLRHDNCREELKGTKTTTWVDCPLIVADRCMGKLSCDVAPSTCLTQQFRSDIRRLWSLAHIVAPTLELLYNESLNPLTEIREEIANCTSLGSLLRYCTESLARRHFGCRYASIFTLSHDHFGSEKLVLSKTSFGNLQAEENRAFYDVSDSALTTWVLRHGESVRLHSLMTPQVLNEQLAAYGGDIGWLDKFTDSETHTTFLAVPLRTKQARLGVLRYTEKVRGEFTESDQVLLERVAKDYISPRLQILARSEFVPDLVDELEQIHAISLSFTSRQALPHELCRAMERCFPETPASKKLYLINLLEENGTHFEHHAIGGSLRVQTDARDRYPLAGSFTKHAMDAGTNTAVLVNDLRRANTSDGFHLICPAAMCALGSPLVFSSRTFGALVVMSERYDLLEQSHRHFLAILAGEASQLFGLKQVLEVSSGLLGMRHDCAALLNRIYELAHQQAVGWKDDLASLIRFLLETVDTYCRPGARDAARFAKYDCVETNVRDEVTVAATAARHEMGTVSGIDCRIDHDLEAVIQPSYLMNIVYNLLKNAWAATPKNGPEVVAKAKVSDRYLSVAIVDQGVGMSPAAVAEYNTTDALRMLTLGLPHRGVKGLGLLVARRIAGWHALPDGRRGEVTMRRGEDGVGICAEVKLPVWTGEC